MNTCRKVGIASRASAPSDDSSVGHLAPAEHLEALGLGDLLHRLAGRRGVLGRLRQERDAGGVAAVFGQVEFDDRAQELVGHLQQDARAVTGVRFGALGTAVLQVHQGRDGLVDDVAAAAAVHVGHHRHTARVVLERGVVQPLTAGRHSHLTLHARLYGASVWQPSTTALAGLAVEVPSCSTERRPYPTRHKWRKRYDKHRLTCQLSQT